MSDTRYETIFEWQGRAITLSVEKNWLDTGSWHLEICCNDLIPITETGYRSQFLAEDALSRPEHAKAHVLASLDAAAEDPAWHRRVEASRQLSLF